jgi:glycosyltransferase involved in cell wall biosynthesis
MRLLYDAVIFEEQEVGGISRIHRELLPRMCDLEPSLEVTCLTTRKTRQPLPAHQRIQVRRILPLERMLRPHRVFGRATWRARPLALRLAVRRGPRAIWLSSYYTWPAGWRGPTVAMVYDLIYEFSPELYRRTGADQVRRRIRETILRARHIICISECTQRDVVRLYGVPQSRTSVVYPGLPLDNVPEGEARFAEQAPPRDYILYVGARWGYKNFLGLLEAFARWSQDVVVTLVCVGGDATWSAEESATLAHLGIAGRVRNLGPVSDTTLAKLYTEARFLVLPSLYEGFGLPLLEAMQYQTLAVVSRTSSLPEVGGDVPFYFDPKERDSIMRAMAQAFQLPEDVRRERVAAGRARAARFSLNAAASALLSVLKETVATDQLLRGTQAPAG